ncbi:T9SS type A sorting domain-containing protein [Cecembia calidifontis]|uniref:Putative secreted protein (Por secretion system target) n=1 Tax=Cecembia calidifontis TaxID=1187080 RepID=A0A4V2F6B8_9BACT|nr:T9SS type A sorting domain-containing protein [Cecembia calidifontis]RZS95769.1 putative secreted protein (Por secretion system target) [Cecembia calidifontis]
MKFLKLISILILFATGIKEAEAQLPNRSCLTCSPPNNNSNQFRLGTVSFTDASGNPIDLNNCPDWNNVYITVLYSASTGQGRTGVFIVSTLEITTNTGNNSGSTRSANFDFSLGDLPLTNGQFRPVTVKVDLPLDFDCQNETARLTNIRAHWSNSGNNARCGGANYPPGQCVNLGTDTRVITVDGFFYSYSSLQNCFEEDNRSLITYFLTNVAGGNGDFRITWNIRRNGVLQPPVEGGLFVSVVANPNDNIEVSVNVRDSNGLTMNPQPAPIIRSIQQPFSATVTASPDIGQVQPSPNGSIRITNLDPSKSFSFQWFDELGNVINPGDPTNLTGLSEGTYSLVMTDLETGVVRCFSRTVNFNFLPVVYEDLSLDFDGSLRAVNFSWSTAKEWETSHFEVERALRIAHFEKIGEVMAAGWSDSKKTYIFRDSLLPLVGGNLFYRLKQINLNGEYEYSKVLSVRIPGMESSNTVWRVFPNPTNGDKFNLELVDSRQYSGEEVQVVLISPSSKPVILSGKDISSLSSQIHSIISNAPKGVYLIQVGWGNRSEQIRVLKN